MKRSRVKSQGSRVVQSADGPRSGFTLVEVLVALVISATAIVLIAQGFSVGASASSSARQATRAAILAESKMSEFESGETSLSSTAPGDFRDAGYPDYKWEVTIDQDSFSAYKVTVTVSWTGRGGPQTFSLVRIMRERVTSQ